MLYEVITINYFEIPGEGTGYSESQVHPISAAIRNDFPGVNAVNTFYTGNGQISIENKNGTYDRYLEDDGLASYNFV